MNYRRILLQLLADIGRSGQDDLSLFLGTAADAVTEALEGLGVHDPHPLDMTWADVTAWAESELEREAT
jgi:hypothetical protein